jgi:hypothetical protein
VANKTNPKNETKEAKKDESKVIEQKKEENKTDPVAPISNQLQKEERKEEKKNSTKQV